ncbi:MAG: toll/interleukin-1 receptor domain-containing protein [Clostridia bacterium]|nr:toll/interleukin-1 receptor domain-containing protein [Clostridia bacterium]
MHDVFISYSHKDKSVADAICANLEANSVKCWYAPRDIAPGDDWADAIMDALSKAKVFVLIFSKHSNLSSQVKNEITSAVSYGCKIIPFCIDSVKMNSGLAYYLNSVHWLDATEKIKEETMKKLYEEICSTLYNKKAVDFVPVPFKIKRRTNFKFLFLGIITAFLVAVLALAVIYLSDSRKTETYSAEVGDIVTFGTTALLIAGGSEILMKAFTSIPITQ